jgi:hypothetical protein
VVNEAMNLAAHTFALTEDGKRIYVLKGQKLIIFQIYPFKFIQSFDVNFKNLPKKARDYMVFRMWVTSDEHFLNIVTRDKVIQFDLLAGKISQTLVFKNKEVYRSSSFKNDLWLFYRNTSIKNSILLSPKYLGEEGQGNTEPNASSIDVLDAHSLKFKKDLSSLFGREFMNSASDRVAQIDDKIILFQPYGFGFYGQNTAWLRVINSNSYQEELRIFGEGIPLLNLDTPIVYLTHATKVRNFINLGVHKLLKLTKNIFLLI